MSSISDGTGVLVETKKETINDAMVAQLTKDLAAAGGSGTVRGAPLDAKLTEVTADAAKNVTIIAIIKV